ncbi:unnamed protein product [Lepidochelys kempii]
MQKNQGASIVSREAGLRRGGVILPARDFLIVAIGRPGVLEQPRALPTPAPEPEPAEG